MQTQRPNPLAALLGRPASSFTVEQLDALPQHTAFGRPDLFGEGDLERLAYASNGDGRWCSAVGPVDSATLRVVSGLVCIAVGEPEVLGIERPADDALRALLPLSPLPLSVVVNVDAVPVAPMEPLLEPRVIDLPPRPARISAADMEEPLELVYRLRRWCGRTGADLSLLVDAHRVSVMFIGDATPDLVDAVQVGGHRQHTDAAGTVTIWRAS